MSGVARKGLEGVLMLSLGFRCAAPQAMEFHPIRGSGWFLPSSVNRNIHINHNWMPLKML